MSDLLILVDGSSYLFRAYHANPNLSNKAGEPTGALFGVVNMLRRLEREYGEKTRRMAVIFDAPGKNFRHEMYPDYKANRPPMPDDLRSQIEPLHEIVRALGLPLVSVAGVEADDVIGTLAQQAADQGIDVLISTGDKDMAQLVNERVTLVNTMDNKTMDRDGVMERFAVWPEQIIDWLALVGDKSDNIPGVPKCGPKTAAKWLAEYGSVDSIIESAEKIGGKVGENLRASLEQLEISRRLATIRLDVELPLSLDQLECATQDTEQLRDHFQRMDSPRLLATLKDADGAPFEVEETPPPMETNYRILLEAEQWQDWLERLKQAELFAFDTETTSLDYMQAQIVGVSMAIEPGEAVYVPLTHDYPGAPDQLQRDRVLADLKPLLEDPDRAKLGQNLKYDMNVLANHGITLRGIAFDTMLESYVVDSTATRHDMDSLAEKYLSHKTIHFEDIAGKGKKQLTFNQIPLDQAGPYAAEDADITLRLHQQLMQKLDTSERQKDLFVQVEMPLVPVLARIERRGVRIDTRLLQQLSQTFDQQIREQEARAHEIAGRPFNLGSPKQIGTIFFEELKLPVLRKTPSGAPSTAEGVLQELADRGEPLPEVILRHRGLSKLKSTYTDKLPRMVNAKTGRVHTSYHQAVAATGRLSSSDPNLQNIPIRREEGQLIRQAFIAEDGYLLLAADYSQIELRILAHLSDDPGLIRAFSTNQDVHRATAAEIFELTPEEITDDQRRSAKAINFGLVYGMSAFGLSNQLGISQADAREYMDRYFQRYPAVQNFMEQTRETAREQGYVETLFGRRLYLPDIRSRNHARRSGAERTAINAPMQGTASDIIKRAMINLDQWIEQEQPPMRMIMQVHDELVFEVKESELDSISQTVRQRMESAAELSVPLIVDCGSGENWQQATDPQGLGQGSSIN